MKSVGIIGLFLLLSLSCYAQKPKSAVVEGPTYEQLQKQALRLARELRDARLANLELERELRTYQFIHLPDGAVGKFPANMGLDDIDEVITRQYFPEARSARSIRSEWQACLARETKLLQAFVERAAQPSPPPVVIPIPAASSFGPLWQEHDFSTPFPQPWWKSAPVPPMPAFNPVPIPQQINCTTFHNRAAGIDTITCN